MSEKEKMELAEQIRKECIQAAREGFGMLR